MNGRRSSSEKSLLKVQFDDFLMPAKGGNESDRYNMILAESEESTLETTSSAPGLTLHIERLIGDESRQPQDSTRSRHHNVVPGPIETEFTSTEINTFDASCVKTETKVGYNARKKMKEETLYMNRDSQTEFISQTTTAEVEENSASAPSEPVNGAPLDKEPSSSSSSSSGSSSTSSSRDSESDESKVTASPPLPKEETQFVFALSLGMMIAALVINPSAVAEMFWRLLGYN